MMNFFRITGVETSNDYELLLQSKYNFKNEVKNVETKK